MKSESSNRTRADDRRRMVDELYRRYGRGRPAAFRARLRLGAKRGAWLIVTQSAYGFKRLMDIVLTIALIVVLSPVFLVAALAIKLEDRGPVLFKQTRVGRHGLPFRILKFRSMVVNADRLKDELIERNETGGVLFKMKRDPRITRAGRVIRKLSIDELPQLFNVLAGDMSLVGPRPPVPREVAEYTQDDRRRLNALPGITCLWQVGGRSELPFPEQVRLDVQYIESQTLRGDFLILLKTIPAVLLGKGAY